MLQVMEKYVVYEIEELNFRKMIHASKLKKSERNKRAVPIVLHIYICTPNSSNCRSYGIDSAIIIYAQFIKLARCYTEFIKSAEGCRFHKSNSK